MPEFINPLLLHRDSSLKSSHRATSVRIAGDRKHSSNASSMPARLSAVCESQIAWDPKARTRKDEDYLCLVTHLGAFAFKDRVEQTYYCRLYHKLPKRHREVFHQVYLDRSLKERIRLAMAAVEREVRDKEAGNRLLLMRAVTLKQEAKLRKAKREWLTSLCRELDRLCIPTTSDKLVQQRRTEIVDMMKSPHISANVKEELRRESQSYANESAASYIKDMDSALDQAVRDRGSKEEVTQVMRQYLGWKKFQSARLMAIKIAAMPRVMNEDGADILLEAERNTYKRAFSQDAENRVQSAHF